MDDYRYVAERLDADSDGIAALEINVSCPNVKEGGISFSSDTAAMGKVVAAVRSATKLPLITKLSPMSDPDLSDDFGYGFAAVAFEIGGDSAAPLRSS